MSPQAAQLLRRQAAFLLVLALLAASLVYLTVQPDHWRRGSGVIAIALLLAGFMRVTLPRRWVGALAVRARWIDSAFYLVVGAGILVVLITVA
jgi:uncharacterized membrane protein YraQ (UPF0718 family)